MLELRNFRECNWVNWNDPSNRMRKITMRIDDTLSNKLMLIDLKKMNLEL